MLVALQFWFWFPLSHFMSLAFRPSALICLNGNLDLPKIEITSHAKPARFAYPPMTEEKKGKEKQKVETAVLSITAKAKARQRAKKVRRKYYLKKFKKREIKVKDEKDGEMETDEKTSSVSIKEEPMEVAEEVKPEPVVPEAKFEVINNPCRALNQQLKVLTFNKEQTRYTPLKPLSQGGIILLRDGRPDEAEVHFVFF